MPPQLEEYLDESVEANNDLNLIVDDDVDQLVELKPKQKSELCGIENLNTLPSKKGADLLK